MRYGHFLISFAIAGLVALTYAAVAAEFVVLRGLYPYLWAEARDFAAVAQRELAPLGRQVAMLPLLAGAIPLAGAVLVVAAGPEDFSPDAFGAFRLVAGGLIVSGLLGFGLASAAAHYLRATLAALTGAAPQPSGR